MVVQANLLLFIKSHSRNEWTVKVSMVFPKNMIPGEPWLSGLFNITQTGCLSGHIFMNVNKMWSQKLKAMQKFIINP